VLRQQIDGLVWPALLTLLWAPHIAFEPTRRYNVSDFDWLPEAPRDLRVLAGPTPDAMPAGMRIAHLTRLAGSMRRRGMTEASITAALMTENEARCRPPLLDGDVRRIARSVGRYAPDPSSEPIAFVNPLPELLERARNINERPGSSPTLHLYASVLDDRPVQLMHSRANESHPEHRP
jgi:hypothetical protein